MTDIGISLLLLAVLIVAARLCLRGERRPPIRPDNEPIGGFGPQTPLVERSERRDD